MNIVLEKDVYVTTYEVTQHFGGHEEGGWWYDWYTPTSCIKVAESKAWEMREELLDSIGDINVDVIVENVPYENRTVQAPYYE